MVTQWLVMSLHSKKVEVLIPGLQTFCVELHIFPESIWILSEFKKCTSASPKTCMKGRGVQTFLSGGQF